MWTVTPGTQQHCHMSPTEREGEEGGREGGREGGKEGGREGGRDEGRREGGREGGGRERGRDGRRDIKNIKSSHIYNNMTTHIGKRKFHGNNFRASSVSRSSHNIQEMLNFQGFRESTTNTKVIHLDNWVILHVIVICITSSLSS